MMTKRVLLKSLLILVYATSRTSEACKKILPGSSTGNVPIIKFATYRPSESRQLTPKSF